MRHIDAFCHFFPAGIFRLMSTTAGVTKMSASACRMFARLLISTRASA